MFAMCCNEDRATMGRVATLLWSIWHHQNDVVWNDNLTSPNHVGRISYNTWNDWFAVHHLNHDENHIPESPTTDRWEKPRIGWVKCNVDAALYVDNFMAAFMQRQQATLSTVEGEAWTLLQAMKEANHRGLDRVQYESDSQVLIEAIQTRRCGNSEFSLIVDDIIQFLC
ncbi:ribonuclease H [Trifolium pratense]|uniref:Ribonuclease H n=1 Tax=Trifolium pratense TaxID=57577 RepID=A0A2K3MTV2_TRIPR|nr:ribonuclease H [Trifolium pratense]